MSADPTGQGPQDQSGRAGPTRGRGDPAQLVPAAAGGDRTAVARLISLVERGGPPARQVGRLTFPRSGKAYTVGITGAPGAGKSTLADGLIRLVRAAGQEVGVLAIDPSSPFSGGAILGDRVRMQDHAVDPGVFIRSMATRGHLGGLALATPEAVRVLDAAGFPLVLIETVGVGQVEVEIAGEADTTVVVVNPGWGDAVQANKAGLLEAADIFVINKADRPGAKETARDLEMMLMMTQDLGEWTPPILTAVATTGAGVDEVWEAVGRHRVFLDQAGLLARRRTSRLESEVRAIVSSRLEQHAYQACRGEEFQGLLSQVAARQLDPYAAAEQVLRTPGGEG